MGSIKRSLANNITTGGKFDATDLSGSIPSSNVANDSLTNITTFSPALGDTIEAVATDPTYTADGSVWYNTTSGTLKGYLPIAAWSAGVSMGTARYTSGTGTQSAAIAAGGRASPLSVSVNNTELYNGISWTTAAVLPATRGYMGGFGTQTAAVFAGGWDGQNTPSAPFAKANSYLFNGASWTVLNSINTARAYVGAVGSQTAGLIFGGTQPSPPTSYGNTESYNGTSWTSVNSMNTDSSFSFWWICSW
jgi:hypothetical protein